MADGQESPLESSELLHRFATGDERAADEIFERYFERLTRLARSKLAAKLASRLDPEDIVMSAYRSFFVAAKSGQFELKSGGDLWRLLAEVTLHKLYHAADRHFADRRSVKRERSVTEASGNDLQVATTEPTPDEALAAADELTAVLGQLSERDQQVLELRLQGYEHEEIAARIACSERTVRRAISEVRRLMAGRAGGNFVPSAARNRPPAASLTPRQRPDPGISASDAPLKWSDFALQEQIGAGATGRVYVALERKSDKEVAVKFLRKSLFGHASAMHRFLAEAQTVASLRHPSIVAVHGAGQTPGGGLFLVMDLVRGSNLEQLRRDQALKMPQIIRWVSDAARAIDFAHKNGVIHCDLKPSNLLVDQDGRIRVTDFGLALRLSDEVPFEGLWAGTPAFMAPEQVDRCWGAIAPQTDVWGLGAILFFLIFGQPPHVAVDVPATLAAVVSKTPVRMPNDARVQIPPALLELMVRCLAKSPDHRIASAHGLADELDAMAST